MRNTKLDDLGRILESTEASKSIVLAETVSQIAVEELVNSLFETDLNRLKELLTDLLIESYKNQEDKNQELIRQSRDKVLQAIEIKQDIKLGNGLVEKKPLKLSAESGLTPKYFGEIQLDAKKIQNSVYPDEVFLQFLISRYSIDNKLQSNDIFKIAKKFQSQNKLLNINLYEILQDNHQMNKNILEEFISSYCETLVGNFGLYGELNEIYDAIAQHISNIITQKDSKFSLMLYRNPALFKTYLSENFYPEFITNDLLGWLNDQGIITFKYNTELSDRQNIAIEIFADKILSHSERKIPSFVKAAKEIIVETLKNEQVFSLITDSTEKGDWEILLKILTESKSQHDKIAALRESNVLCGRNLSPLELVVEILKQENVSYSQQMVEAILKEVATVLKNDEIQFKKLSVNISGWVRAICNRIELSKLYVLLSKKMGEKYADSVFSNWKIISEDIRDNRRVLTHEDIERIVSAAEREFLGAQQTRELLSLQDKLISGELPASPKVAKQQFPRLFQHAEVSDPSKVNLVLNRALVIQQLKNPNNPDFIELAILEFFKLPVSNLKENKDQIHEKLMLMLNAIEDTDLLSTASFQEIKAQVQASQFQARFLTLGGDPKIAPLIPIIIKILKEQSEKLISLEQKQIDEMKSSLAEGPLMNYPLRQAWFSRHFESIIRSNFRESFIEYVTTILNDYSDDFIENNIKTFETKFRKIITILDFSQNVSQNSAKKFNLAVNVEKYHKIYEKYKDNMVVEMIQGLDQQEVFLRGVCEAVSVRFAKYLHDNPNMELSEQMQEQLRVKPSDRFFQSSCVLDKWSMEKETIAPPLIAKKYGTPRFPWRPDSYYKIDNRDDCGPQLKEKIQKFGSGIFLVAFFGKNSGHETVLILDEQNHRYGFFDCNFGLFNFPVVKNDKITAMNQAIDCAADIFRHYNAFERILLRQSVDTRKDINNENENTSAALRH